MTPDDHTNQELMLDVGDGHQLYVHDWGKPDAGKVIIWLHGGPGNGCSDSNKARFDPERQRVIFYDQRGCGRSLPYGSLEHNTTDKLLADITRIADELKIGKFILNGNSWGTALALAYAIDQPERVEALVLGAIFTAAQDEIDWVDGGGFQKFYPEVWERYVLSVPGDRQHDPTAYHRERAFGDDEQAAKESLYAYNAMEMGILWLDDRVSQPAFETFDPAGTRMEMHYLSNRCFLPDNHIMKNAHKIEAPVWLVHGRYDMVCPPSVAYRLHQRLPRSELIWTVGGHTGDRETWNVMRTILLMM